MNATLAIATALGIELSCWPLRAASVLFICAAGLAEVLRYHAEQPLVQGIWRAMAAQLGACTDCVNAYHAAQARVQKRSLAAAGHC